MSSTAYVICLNDYPDLVFFGTQEETQQQLDTRRDEYFYRNKSAFKDYGEYCLRCYWHVRSVPVLGKQKISQESMSVLKLSSLYYPIMLTQEFGEISESKASELLGMNIEEYRDTKEKIVAAVLKLLETLPSPLTLLLESVKNVK